MVAKPPVRSASTFVVLSGGPIGAAATRQLLRAIAARRLLAGRIVVVDKDKGCAAAALVDDRVELAVADWVDWLDAHLDGLPADAQLVPYHWAPHVLVQWLSRQVERAGGRAFRGGDLPGFSTPVDRPTRDGDRALSYATWICPPPASSLRFAPTRAAPRTGAWPATWRRRPLSPSIWTAGSSSGVCISSGAWARCR